MKRLIFSVISIFLFSLPAFATAPVCLFTDVPSGPAAGGEGGNGIYLTIFGKNFGPTQGTSTVTINGKPAAQYLMWTQNYNSTAQDAIGVQVANGTTGTGNIVVTTSGGSCSNLSFTVRTGKIYFVGPSADTSSPGNCSSLLSSNSYSSPWGLTNVASKSEGSYSSSSMRTPYTYYNCMSAGDTLVFLNGVNYLGYDGRGWHAALTLDKSGTSASNFSTIMARPGATVKLGGTGYAMYGVRASGSPQYNVYSGLTMTGSGSNGNGLSPDPYDRVVGNTISCPDCSGPQGALFAGNNNEVLGNLIDAVSTDTPVLPHGSNKTYHAVYMQGNNFEFGWNRIYNTAAYNGIQVNEDGTAGFYNFSIHDNDIADVNGSGVNLSTIDPYSGYVEVYNNIIHHTGVALASDGSSGDPHSCIAVKGYGTATGSGTADIYNNTMYDCSSYLNASGSGSSNSESCAILVLPNQLNVTSRIVDNIAYEPAYASTSKYNVYICGDGTAGTLSGSNNIWYSGSAPGSTEFATNLGTIEDPLFVDAADGPWTNFELQSSSRAIGGGIAPGSVYALGGTNDAELTWDFNGVTRPGSPAIGALEYGSGSTGTGTGSSGPISTTVSLGASPNPATVNEGVTLTATVAKTGSTTPAGSITFKNGSTTLGTASLDSTGTATLTISSLAAGTYAITADYGGSSSYDAVNSSGVSLQVNPAASTKSTTTTLGASASSITSGKQLILTATVRANGATPTGTVIFHLGSTVLGTATLNQAGIATITTSSLTVGTHSLSAKYLGTSSFLVSYSAIVKVTVTN